MTGLFAAYGKTPRLYRDVVVTEKIDGTNAAVIVVPQEEVPAQDRDVVSYVQTASGDFLAVGAQSRNRLVYPGVDNYGFAAWVFENSLQLAELLGQGRHYGEWWGQGIQRGYGLDHRRFSLFNTTLYAHIPTRGHGRLPTLSRVPTLAEGTLSDELIEGALNSLRENGSLAALRVGPHGAPPVAAEGVIAFHTQSRQAYKVLLDHDHLSKTEASA